MSAHVDVDVPGSAYLFVKPAGGWVGTQHEAVKLLAFDGAPHDSFGNGVSISGHSVVVGAPYRDDNGESSGAAYVFELGDEEAAAEDEEDGVEEEGEEDEDGEDEEDEVDRDEGKSAD